MSDPSLHQASWIRTQAWSPSDQPRVVPPEKARTGEPFSLRTVLESAPTFGKLNWGAIEAEAIFVLRVWVSQMLTVPVVVIASKYLPLPFKTAAGASSEMVGESLPYVIRSENFSWKVIPSAMW